MFASGREKQLSKLKKQESEQDNKCVLGTETTSNKASLEKDFKKNYR